MRWFSGPLFITTRPHSIVPPAHKRKLEHPCEPKSPPASPSFCGSVFFSPAARAATFHRSPASRGTTFKKKLQCPSSGIHLIRVRATKLLENLTLNLAPPTSDKCSSLVPTGLAPVVTPVTIPSSTGSLSASITSDLNSRASGKLPPYLLVEAERSSTRAPDQPRATSRVHSQRVCVWWRSDRSKMVHGRTASIPDSAIVRGKQRSRAQRVIKGLAPDEHTGGARFTLKDSLSAGESKRLRGAP